MTLQTLSVVAEPIQAITVGALGVFAGAMLTEAGVLVPYWRSLDARTFHEWYRANASRLARFFGALTWTAGLSALACALLAVALEEPHMARSVVAAGLMLTTVAMFPLYFKGANARFVEQVSSDDTARALQRWATWHWVRTAISFGAFAAAAAAM